jgi:benzoyl-CoA reductase/2-hydroxyglutaryl-CoA dehydratase subunit BcrC/BadD/HgdB
LNDSVTPKFVYQLDVPHASTQMSVDYFTNVLQTYISALEKQFNVKITRQALIRSIKVFNKTRRLLQRLYELRKRTNPPVSGGQFIQIIDICLTTPKEEFNEKFEMYLKTLEKKKGGMFNDYRTRILIFGGMFNPDLVNFVESDETKGVVVCEDACNGIRYFDKEVDLDVDTDPVKAISRRYISHMPCPRIAGRRLGERMPKDLINLVREYNAEGVIYYVTKRCENLYWEFPFIKKALEEQNIPLKRLEGDISGEVRKREIKSFIELIEF